jgi:two-component system phosphate regulon sensor histidine kinase PhoR
LLGVLTIVGIIGIQSYWVINTWNINEGEFNHKVYRSLYQVAKSLAEYNDTQLPQHNIINQRSTNYFIVNIESEIDANVLELFLRRELEANALNIDFEYAVFDCTTDKMVYGDYCTFSAAPKENIELGNLPKYDEFTYYFGVKFPGRPGYLYSKMQLSAIFSTILLLAIVFFGYAIYVILRQRQLSELQKDFINNMTHEFKTPISTIKVSADVFLHTPAIQEDARLWRYANIVKNQNERLNRQVEKVLQLAKIEKGNFDIKLEKLHLGEVLESVEQTAALQIEKLGGKLESNWSETGAVVIADRLHFTNVLHNLLDNAIKYSQGPPSVKLWIDQNGADMQISISDRGIGIDKDFQSKVFDKFFRVPTGNIHQVKGFGIGLYYVKKICDAHRWRLHMASEAGQGTTITITIPTRSISRGSLSLLWEKLRGRRLAGS